MLFLSNCHIDSVFTFYVLRWYKIAYLLCINLYQQNNAKYPFVFNSKVIIYLFITLNRKVAGNMEATDAHCTLL